jgi:diketogulonate reductase-like aldo/keto reductase
MNDAKAPFITLNNGIQMPQLGLGVWKASVDEAEAAVTAALKAGYRLIDTAMVYGNEEGVGKAIRASSIPREDIFVTTKLWNHDQGHDKVRPAFEASLQRLGLDYVDLYLIHWPMPARELYVETWQEFEKLYAEKKIRAIGVSNFEPAHLEKLAEHATITPAVNQIELHPRFTQPELREYGKEHGIHIESWKPIGGAGGSILQDETISKVAKKYKKTTAQVVIRWHLQHNLIVIPKSVHEDRIKQNIDVFDFELTQDDMNTIDDLETGQRLGPDPNTVNGN